MDKVRFRITLALVFIGGLGISVGVPIWASTPFFNAYPHLEWFLREVVPKIGDAMLIAPILAIVVDKAAKYNLLSEFAEDVSSHIIGRLLPPELREHIQHYLTADVIRRDLDIVYVIRELSDKPGYIELESVLTSDLQNCTAKDRVEEMYYSVSKSLIPQVGQTVITEITAGPFSYRVGDPSPKSNAMGDEEFKVKVPLLSATARTEPQTVRCIAKSKEYLPADGGLNPYIAVYPVLGTTVTVICPPHYKVDIDLTFTLHPDAHTEKIEQPQGTKWLIKSPMLPGQGFFIRWAK